MHRTMRYIIIAVLLLFAGSAVQAQVNWPSPEAERMYQEARQYHSQGQLRDAIIRYQQAIQMAPNVVLLYRELAHAYYLAQGHDQAIQTLEPVIEQNAADAEAYKIMALSQIAIGETKKAKKTLKDAVTRLPNAGAIYHQMGVMYADEGDMVYAIESWLDGIEKEPTYHLNYYEAAKFYINTDKPVWTIIYGEIFVNMEQQTKRSYDTRKLIIDAYVKMFTTVNTDKVPKFGNSKNRGKREFEDDVYDTYIRLASVLSDGYTTENLTILRTRFIMDWTQNFARKYPFTLFSRHDEMIRNGYFDMYNQWLFGKVENAQQYAAWQKFHPKAIPAFESWLSVHPYRPDSKEFYNPKDVDNLVRKNKG